jgi:hypothetical protein
MCYVVTCARMISARSVHDHCSVFHVAAGVCRGRSRPHARSACRGMGCCSSGAAHFIAARECSAQCRRSFPSSASDDARAPTVHRRMPAAARLALSHIIYGISALRCVVLRVAAALRNEWRRLSRTGQGRRPGRPLRSAAALIAGRPGWWPRRRHGGTPDTVLDTDPSTVAAR